MSPCPRGGAGEGRGKGAHSNKARVTLGDEASRFTCLSRFIRIGRLIHDETDMDVL